MSECLKHVLLYAIVLLVFSQSEAIVTRIQHNTMYVYVQFSNFYFRIMHLTYTKILPS